VWMRQSVRDQMAAAREKHIQSVNSACYVLGTRPFVVNGEFSTASLTAYFMGKEV
jgi:hypothetical protein